MSEPKPLTDEQMARFIEGAQRLSILESVLVAFQREFVAEAWRFQCADVTQGEVEPPVGTLRPIPETAIYVVRDSQGKVVATDVHGKLIYRNPEDKFVTGPFTAWLVNDDQILLKIPVWDEREYDLVDVLK